MNKDELYDKIVDFAEETLLVPVRGGSEELFQYALGMWVGAYYMWAQVYGEEPETVAQETYAEAKNRIAQSAL